MPCTGPCVSPSLSPALAVDCLIQCIVLQGIGGVILCLHWDWRNHKFYFTGIFHIPFIYFNLQNFSKWGDEVDKEMVLPSPCEGRGAPKGDVSCPSAQGSTETL